MHIWGAQAAGLLFAAAKSADADVATQQIRAGSRENMPQ
jgi:hypothetical protein